MKTISLVKRESRKGYRIVLMALKDHVKDVEQMFRVSIDYF
jgi:hypothetical protein